MVADFVSADYGWLRTADGASARVLFRAGKNRDGYFTSEEILDHATHTMDIISERYPDDDHVLIFDNAPTHLKRAADSLSARHMPKNPAMASNAPFQVETNEIGPDRKPVYRPDGKLKKTKINMHDTTLPDGRHQHLYYPPGHPHAGDFRGMAELLEECSYADAKKLCAECKGFKCPATPPAGASSCCCRRLIYNEPDFTHVESLLEAHCRCRGFKVIFLPKFHCELNCIEQCWGYAKREYRKQPPLSADADLERNVVETLDVVPLILIRHFYTRSMLSRSRRDVAPNKQTQTITHSGGCREC